MADFMEFDSVSLRKMRILETMLNAVGSPKWLSIGPGGERNQGGLGSRDPLGGHPRHPMDLAPNASIVQW